MVRTMVKRGWIVIAAAAVLCATAEANQGKQRSTGFSGPYLGQEPPGNTPVLFAPGFISTGKEHSAAMFSPDGQEVWFGRILPAAVYYSRATRDGWTEPQVAPFCDTYNYLYPVLSPDGQQLFFTSDRPVHDDGNRIPRGDGRIWVVERQPGGWSGPRLLPAEINFGDRQSCGSLTANGSVYFSAKEDDYAPDIYYSQPVDGGYSPARKPAGVNSETPEHSPFVGPEEGYLIFSSFRGGYGRSDLYVCFRNADGRWSEPKNMGQTVNSAYKDEFPYVTADGKYLFFNSNRPSSLNSAPIPDGPGNIYWVSTAIIEEIR